MTDISTIEAPRLYPTLRYKDAEAVMRWLKDVIGFTERVVKGDKTLYRARFAGLDKEQAEAACQHLKKNEIACMALKN